MATPSGQPVELAAVKAELEKFRKETEQIKRELVKIPPPPAAGGILGQTRCRGGAVEGTSSQLMPAEWTIAKLLGTAPPTITQADNGSGQRELFVTEAGWYDIRADVRWSLPTSCDGIRVHVRAKQPDDGFTAPTIAEVPTRFGFRNDGWHSNSIWGAIATLSTGRLYLDPADDGRILLEVMAEGTVSGATLTDCGNAANPPYSQLLVTRLA